MEVLPEMVVDDVSDDRYQHGTSSTRQGTSVHVRIT